MTSIMMMARWIILLLGQHMIGNHNWLLFRNKVFLEEKLLIVTFIFL